MYMVSRERGGVSRKGRGGAAKRQVDRSRGGVGGKGRVSRPKKTLSWRGKG